MPKRKRKKPFFDFFGFDEEDFLFGREPVEGGSGYSISVTYGESGKPVVQVKTHGDVDLAELRRSIEQRYPGARIEGLEKKPLIRIVGEEKEEKERKTKKSKIKGKAEKKSLIRVE
jgi:hypothetical protein